MDNVTIKVTIEVTQTVSWSENKSIARSVVEETSSTQMEELGDKMVHVVEDAQSRAMRQLENTRRIKTLEERNRLLAVPLSDNVPAAEPKEPLF